MKCKVFFIRKDGSKDSRVMFKARSEDDARNRVSRYLKEIGVQHKIDIVFRVGNLSLYY